ncbi:MAG: hypothetical protein JWM11_2920 [Planctomycetaceae bacterium]|nr:hypothetical protein [Planctomycetaceae bacterium]
MVDESQEAPDIAVPKTTLRAVQILIGCSVTFLVLLATIVLWLVLNDDSKQEGKSSVLLTSVACGFTGIAFFVKFKVLDSIFQFVAWHNVPPETCNLSRFKRGSHYLCGVIVNAGCYFFSALMCWIMFFLEHEFATIALGVTLIFLMLVEFPRISYANAWSKRYFQRPATIPNG